MSSNDGITTDIVMIHKEACFSPVVYYRLLIRPLIPINIVIINHHMSSRVGLEAGLLASKPKPKP